MTKGQLGAEARMHDDRPNVEPLQRAVARLEEGLVRYRRDTSDIQVRDGLIQRFEFTYESAHKTLKRYLEYASANPEEVDAMTFQDLIRSASEQGLLLGEWPHWRTYREMRARTSHTYDEDIALDVVRGVSGFLEEARHLLDKLRERLA